MRTLVAILLLALPLAAEDADAPSADRANSLLREADAALKAGEDPAESLRLTRASIAAAGKAAWAADTTAEFHRLALQVMDKASRFAEDDKKAEEKDWDRIARFYEIAAELLGVVPPEKYPASQAMVLFRNAEEALENAYFESKRPAAFAWTDLRTPNTKWKGDDLLRISDEKTGLVLSFPDNRPEKAGFYWLAGDVGWKDCVLRLDFTARGGFQVIVRSRPGQVPGATFDCELLRNSGVLEDGKRSTIEFWVYQRRFRMRVGDKLGRASFCPPSAVKSGGVSFRITPGTSLTIHKIEVKVLTEDTPK